MISAGKFKGKVVDYGVKETKTGKPMIEVWFEVDNEGTVPWRGFLTEKTVERTLKTLALCGLKGPLESIADGPIGGALDPDKELDIDVELVASQKDASKKYPQVKWVNDSRSSKFDAAVTQSVKNKLGQFSGNWAKVRQELGIKKDPSSVGF
jgi:hypothetical protein